MEIDQTPIKKLEILSAQFNADIFVKLESAHPSGSVKERPALNMVKTAIEKGELKKNGVIVEASSGNTGIGLAFVAKQMGVRVIITLPESAPPDRKKILDFLGAEVVLTPAIEGMKGAMDKAAKLLMTIPNAWTPMQFSNPDNPKAHYLTTGPEIWQQLDECVDALVAGVGTGGTFSGTTRFLKEHNPKMLAFAVEPAQSFVLRGGKAAPHNIAGISPGFIPANFDKSLCDGIIPIDEAYANDVIGQLLLKEGLNVNISSAANIAAAMHLAAQRQFENKNIVTFICDNAQVDQRIQKIQQFYGK